ncbi:MAG TPA: hypothetical protein VKB46_04195 [Pyrinomonadaceae bacterium]|nr:hypothetical protein [Pyrinomonadaceae bacterium]
MQCPRCKSPRIQRDYDDALIVLRMVGMQKLLCNTCGLVFKRFDPLGKQVRSPSQRVVGKTKTRRRGRRYQGHLPASISLIEGNVTSGKASYSQPSRGHCQTISAYGMSLTLVGTRFAEADLSRRGRLLFVTVDLPEGPVEAVVSIVSHERVGEEGKRKWVLGVSIHQMADADNERLSAFLEKRAQDSPVIVSE